MGFQSGDDENSKKIGRCIDTASLKMSTALWLFINRTTAMSMQGHTELNCFAFASVPFDH